MNGDGPYRSPPDDKPKEKTPYPNPDWKIEFISTKTLSYGENYCEITATKYVTKRTTYNTRYTHTFDIRINTPRDNIQFKISEESLNVLFKQLRFFPSVSDLIKD